MRRTKARRGGRAVAVALALAALSAGTALSATIAVEGNRRVEAETIRSHFQHDGAAALDPAAVDAGLKALYATGLFEDVAIGRTSGGIVVKVVENPVINRLAFEGNKKAKDDQIASEIQSKARGTFSRPQVQSDAARIVDLYHRSGRYDVRVEPKVISLPDNRVDLVFEINEGAKTGIAAIAFTGNTAFSALKLRDTIKTGETNWLSFLKSNDIYDPDRVEVDADLLRRFYLKNGYADVRIAPPAAAYDPAKKGFILTFAIEEGEPYRFGKIDVQSALPEIRAGALTTKLRTKTGAVYNADAVDKTAEDMTVELAKLGYPFAVVRPRGDRKGEARLIDLTYAVEQGGRSYVERINIRGNSKTREVVIRREFEIAEGDAYNRALIDRAERRLRNLGYFKKIKIASQPGSSADRVVVDVEVEEDFTGEYSISGGYSTTDGFIGELSVGERNLFGTGKQVKASLLLGQYSKGASVAMVEPYFLGTRMSLGLDVFGRQTSVSNYQSYGSESYGANTKLTIPLTEELTEQLRYSVYNQRLTLAPALNDCAPANPPPGCYGNGEASLPIKQAAAAGSTWVSSVGTTTTYSTLDNPKKPTSGLRAETRQDVAGLGGDVNFYRTSGDLYYFQPITDSMTGIARTQGGYITGFGGKQVPLMNSFFGGPQYVRGFAPNGFGPRDLTPGTTNDNIGGSMYWASTVEVQSAIPYLPSEFGLKAAVFADAGSVWGYRGPTNFPSLSGSLLVSDANVIRSSFGAGLIWDSPFGAIRADYAFPITKSSSDKLQAFRFGPGAAF